jgi:PhnB protein
LCYAHRLRARAGEFVKISGFPSIPTFLLRRAYEAGFLCWDAGIPSAFQSSGDVRDAGGTGLTTEPRGMAMRFMVIVKANKDSEAGVLPDTEALATMGKYNEELVKAGVMLAGEGLHPSSKGVRVRFSGKQRTVTDGPFAGTTELIAGFWLWQVRSREEAIEWLKRAPFDGGTEVELRPVFEAEDFGAALTPELREQEQHLRAQAAGGNSVKPLNGPASVLVKPYLFFEGRCDEAIAYYRTALGAEVKALMRYTESPEPPPPGMLPPGSEKKVMHAEFHVGNTTVMASDGMCSGKPDFQGFSISLEAPNDAEAKRLFDALADGGEVRMPLGPTFFASSFGMAADRFGVGWMIIVRR